MEMRGSGSISHLHAPRRCNSSWLARSRHDGCLPLGSLNYHAFRRFGNGSRCRSGLGFRCAELGETGAPAAIRVDQSRQERGKGRSAHLNHAGGGESGAKSAREPLQVDRAAAGEDWTLMLLMPRRAAQPVPGPGLSVEPFQAPVLAEPSVLCAPSKTSSPGAAEPDSRR